MTIIKYITISIVILHVEFWSRPGRFRPMTKKVVVEYKVTS